MELNLKAQSTVIRDGCIRLAMGIVLAATAFGASNMSRDLQNVTKTIDVLIQFNVNPPSAAAIASVTKGGGTLKKQFKNITGTAVYTLPAAVIPALATNTNVKYASPDRQLKGKLEFAEPTTGAGTALQFGYNGTGVTVAIIDSGIGTSNDLSSRVIYSKSFLAVDTTTNDAYGHGTHVAGIIGGSGANSSAGSAIYTFKGIAPAANLVNLRVLDANGQGTDAAVIAAIDHAITLKTQLTNPINISVINLSLGRQVLESYTLDPLCQAVERAWKAGIVTVVAAGNNGRDNSQNTNGYATITSPGNDPYVITVGSMKDMGTLGRADDLMASYSSKGPTLDDHIAKPDLVAPGNNIIAPLAPSSTIITKFPANVVPISYYKNVSTTKDSSTYFKLSGTSMAAPMVAGAAALLLQQDPTLTPDSIKARLMKTATKTFPVSSSVTDTTTNITYTKIGRASCRERV